MGGLWAGIRWRARKLAEWRRRDRAPQVAPGHALGLPARTNRGPNVVVLLFLVSFITFVIFYLFPSADPALLRAGRQPNPELVEQIRHNLGIDNPWYQQY